MLYSFISNVFSNVIVEFDTCDYRCIALFPQLNRL